MKIPIISIGNSKGVRIPKTLLQQCGFGEEAELTLEQNRLVLSPHAAPRAQWDEAFCSLTKKKRP